jgi:hypothetical protein
MCKITKLACQNSDPSFISLRNSTELLLFFTSLLCILPQLNLSSLCFPSDIEYYFCHLLISGEYSLVELSVLLASITCFPKAILINKKYLKRFQRAQKAVFDLNVYQKRIYIGHKWAHSMQKFFL